MIGRIALGVWTSSTDKTIRQKRALLNIEQLFDVFFFYQSRVSNGLPDFTAQLTVLVTVRAAVVVVFDLETLKVTLMISVGFGDDFFFAPAFFSGTNHDCSAVCVISPHEYAIMSTQFLKPDPDVSLNVFDQVAKVNRTVRVG